MGEPLPQARPGGGEGEAAALSEERRAQAHWCHSCRWFPAFQQLLHGRALGYLPLRRYGAASVSQTAQEEMARSEWACESDGLVHLSSCASVSLSVREGSSSTYSSGL